MKELLPYIIIFITLIIIYTIISAFTFINLTKKQKETYKLLEEEIKKKANLIPGFVEIIRNYNINRNDILKSLIEARNKLAVSSSIEETKNSYNIIANKLNELSNIINKTEIRHTFNYTELTKSIREIDALIEIKQNNYNSITIKLNKKAKMFPNNIIKNILKIKKENIF